MAEGGSAGEPGGHGERDRYATGGDGIPLLANVYLHYVFDLWAQQWRKRHARGDPSVVRYADDTVLGFGHEADAKRFWADLRRRSEAFGRKPSTFWDSRGCGTSRTGGFQLLRKTRHDRMQATLQRVKQEVQCRRYEPIPVQGSWLAQVIRGFNAYHAVPTNYRSPVLFRVRVTQLWKRALMRRGQRAMVPWTRMMQLRDRYLPRPRILHPGPDRRLAVKHPRWEPCA